MRGGDLLRGADGVMRLTFPRWCRTDLRESLASASNFSGTIVHDHGTSNCSPAGQLAQRAAAATMMVAWKNVCARSELMWLSSSRRWPSYRDAQGVERPDLEGHWRLRAFGCSDPLHLESHGASSHLGCGRRDACAEYHSSASHTCMGRHLRSAQPGSRRPPFRPQIRQLIIELNVFSCSASEGPPVDLISLCPKTPARS